MQKRSPTWSRKIGTLGGNFAKAALAALLIYWLLRSDRLDFGALAFGPGASVWILAGALCVFAGQWLLAARLWLLLRQRLAVPFRRALGLTLIGSFTGSVLPGLVGGDAVKALYLFGDAKGQRSRAVAVVMVDRAVGLFSLFLLGALAGAVAMAADVIQVPRQILLAAPTVVAGALAGAVLVSRPGFSTFPLIRVLWDRLPEPVRNLTRELHEYLRQPGLLLAAVGLSLVNHALVVVSFVMAGLLLKDGLAPFSHFVLAPLAMVMNLLPLTPGGIGITEGAFSFLYEFPGSPNGATIGLLGRLIQYLTFTVGGTAALVLVRMGARGGRDSKTPPEEGTIRR